VITAVNPFDLPGQGSDLRDLAVKQMERASQLLEAESGQRGAMANSLIVAGKYEQVLNEFKDQTDASDSIADAVAWAWVLKGLASMDAAEKEGLSPDAADKLLLDAIGCDEEALKLRPHMAEAHFNWGYALGARSKLKSGDEARRLFEEARAEYAKARKLDPDDYETPYNLGNLLGDRAEIVEDDDEAVALLRAAIDEYRTAEAIKGKDIDVLTNLAATYRALADRIDDPAPALRQAYDAYADALTLAPRDYDLMYGQALTAAVLSSTDEKFGDLAEMQFLELAQKHPTAEVFVDWGSLLYDRDKIDKAEHRWLKAEEARKGSAAYFLARLYANRYDAERAKTWLLVAHDTDQLPAIDDVKEEPDFESLRDLDWFKDFTR
jgi:tetratricopeptide (TPR) repeat protein